MVMFSSMIWEWSKEHIEEARTSHRLYTISSHDPFHKLAYLKMTHKKGRILLMIYTITLYKKSWANLKFLGNQLQQIFEFSQLLVLNLYNKKLRNFLKNKSAEAGCLKILSWLNFFLYSVIV